MINSFLLNKYTKWYYNIINSRRDNLVEGYSERHHIIPKSLGGTNHTTNLVALTAREHYLCHLLLTRMTNGTDHTKMLRAFNAFKMSSRKNPRNLTARQYDTIRQTTAGLPGSCIGPRDPAIGRKISAALTGRKQSAEANAKRSATLAGRIFSPGHLAKLSLPKRFAQGVSPLKGIKKPYRSMPTVACEHCGKTMSRANISRHILIKHDGNKSS
jgi:hypothetical protein